MSAFADVKEEKTLNELLMSDPDEPQSSQEAWRDPDLIVRGKW